MMNMSVDFVEGAFLNLFIANSVNDLNLSIYHTTKYNGDQSRRAQYSLFLPPLPYQKDITNTTQHYFKEIEEACTSGLATR